MRAIIVTFTLLSMPPWGIGQEAPTEDAPRIAVSAPTEPVLIRIKSRSDIASTVDLVIASRMHEVALTSEVDLIDTVGMGEEGQPIRCRYVARWHTENGEQVQDPPLNGVTIDYAGGDEPGEPRIVDERAVGRDWMRTLRCQASSIGLTLAIPDALKTVGDSAPVDLAPLIPLLFSLRDPPKDCITTLRVDAIEARRNLAVLSGPFSFQHVKGVQVLDAKASVDYSGTVTITIDVEAERITDMTLGGKMSGEGQSDLVKLKVDGRFSVTAEAAVGADVVRALRATARLRDRSFASSRAGVEFKLRSDWSEDGERGTADRFLMRLPKGEGCLVLETSAQRTADPGGKLARDVESWKSELTSGRVTIAPTRAGNGRSVEGRSGEEHVLTDLIPLKSSLVTITIRAPAAGATEAKRQLKRVRRSLQAFR